MSTQTAVKQLNKEVKTLRRDLIEIKTALLKALAVPDDRVGEYKNAAHIRKALQKALKTHPPV